MNADSAINGGVNPAETWASFAEELSRQADKDAEEIHKLKQKHLMDLLNREKTFKIKQEAELLLYKTKLEFQAQEKLKKSTFKNEKEKAAYEKKLQELNTKAIEKLLKAQASKRREEELKLKKAELKELLEAGVASFKDYMSVLKAGLKVDVGKELKKALTDPLVSAGKALKSVASDATKSVDSAMTMYSGVYSKMNARLQGTSKDAEKIFDLMNDNLGASPYVNYGDMVTNTADLINKGIAYNIEERAFLQTIKDKIADTFDAATGTLLQIIRIQQADSTQARLGMEASLTAFLNSNFKDTSYLSDVFDTVTDTIADSVVLLGFKGGTEYEYLMQKWLGSLYSMGVSNSTITNLASAINMLATGDVSGLESSGLLNLLVMAANRSGVSYGDLLTNGVNASNVNAIMSNIVGYWSELALDTNQVVRKLKSSLFGLDMADLVAIRNVDNAAMENMIKTNMTYSGMTEELSSLLGKVSSRMHVSELIENAYNNVIQGIGRNIANSPGMMATWLINDMIKTATGGINIPFITAMGSGIDLNTDANSLILLGMVGIGTLGQIGNIVNSIQSKGGLSLDAWRGSETLSTGGGFNGVVSGVTNTTSRTLLVANSSGSDIKDSTLNAAYDNVDTTVANQAMDDADKMLKAIVDHIDPNISAILDILRAVSTGSSLRVKVEDYGLVSSF